MHAQMVPAVYADFNVNPYIWKGGSSTRIWKVANWGRREARTMHNRRGKRARALNRLSSTRDALMSRLHISESAWFFPTLLVATYVIEHDVRFFSIPTLILAGHDWRTRHYYTERNYLVKITRVYCNLLTDCPK